MKSDRRTLHSNRPVGCRESLCLPHNNMVKVCFVISRSPVRSRRVAPSFQHLKPSNPHKSRARQADVFTSAWRVLDSHRAVTGYSPLNQGAA
jgi:hypothetical protein